MFVVSIVGAPEIIKLEILDVNKFVAEKMKEDILSDF